MLNSKDASLFERLRHHDEDAWALLFKEQYGILCVVASGYLKDDYVAESVVSDVLYNFYIKISSLNLSVSIRSIRTKFHSTDTLGPSSRPIWASGYYEGVIVISL